MVLNVRFLRLAALAFFGNLNFAGGLLASHSGIGLAGVRLVTASRIDGKACILLGCCRLAHTNRGAQTGDSFNAESLELMS